MDTFKRFVLACSLFFLFFVTGCSKKIDVPIQYVCSDGWLILHGAKNRIIECTATKYGIEHTYLFERAKSQYQNGQINYEWYKWADDYNKALYIIKLDSFFLSSKNFEINIKYYRGGGKYKGFIKSEVKNGKRTNYYSKFEAKTTSENFEIHVLQRDEYLLNSDVQKYFQKLEKDAKYFNQKIFNDPAEIYEGNRKEFIALTQLGLLRYSNNDLNKIANFLNKEISKKIKGIKVSDFIRHWDLANSLTSTEMVDKVKFLLIVLQNAKNPIDLDILSDLLDKLENYPYGDKNGVDGRSILLSLPEVRDMNGPNVDTHEEVRRLIISTLGEMGDAALPIILKIEPRSGFADVDNELYFPWQPGQRNQYIRWDGIWLARALGSIGNPSAYSYLVKLYNASSRETKDAVITAIGKIRNPKGIPFLYKLYFKQGSNKIYILRSLGEIRDIKAIKYLVKIDNTIRLDNPYKEFVVEALLVICEANVDALPLIFNLYDSDKGLFTKLFKRIEDKRIDDFLSSRN